MIDEPRNDYDKAAYAKKYLHDKDEESRDIFLPSYYEALDEFWAFEFWNKQWWIFSPKLHSDISYMPMYCKPVATVAEAHNYPLADPFKITLEEIKVFIDWLMESGLEDEPKDPKNLQSDV